MFGGFLYLLKSIIRDFKMRIFFTIVFVFFGAACVAVAIYTKKVAKATIENDASYFTQTVSERFNYLKVKTEQFKYNTTLQKYLSSGLGTRSMHFDDILNMLDHVATDEFFVESAWVSDFMSDLYFNNLGFRSEKGWISGRPWVNSVLEGNETFITPPFYSLSLSRYIVNIITPIRNKNGECLGAFGLDFDFGRIHEMLDSIRYDVEHVRNYDGLFVISPDNVVVYDFNGIYEFVPFSETSAPLALKDIVGSETDGLVNFRSRNVNYTSFISNINVSGWRVVLWQNERKLISHAVGKSRYIHISSLILLIICFSFPFIYFYFKLKDERYRDSLKTHDDTTDALNKLGFENVVLDLLTKNTSKSYVYVVLRIRKFPIMQNMLGNELSDALLIHTSECIKESLSTVETYGRIGINRFALLLGYISEDRTVARLKELDRRIVHMEEFLKRHFGIQIAFGCYAIPDNNMSITKINSNAEIALSKAVEESSFNSSFIFFSSDLGEKANYQATIENSIKNAIANNDFIVYYQGKFDVDTGRLDCAEALVRWQHKELGIIPPKDFIPLFEKNNFITKLDFNVINQVCAQLRSWIDKGLSVVPIAVNLSRSHLNNKHLAKDILAVLKRYNLDPRLIEVEITEGAADEGMDNLSEAIKTLRENGISVAIDDFGAGASNLGNLKSLVVDTLKIDKAFFLDLENNERGRTVAKNIYSLAQDLKLSTVSEGIETSRQLEILRELGGKLVQGFYFSKPIPAEDFEKKYLREVQNDNNG